MPRLRYSVEQIINHLHEVEVSLAQDQNVALRGCSRETGFGSVRSTRCRHGIRQANPSGLTAEMLECLERPDRQSQDP